MTIADPQWQEGEIKWKKVACYRCGIDCTGWRNSIWKRGVICEECADRTLDRLHRLRERGNRMIHLLSQDIADGKLLVERLKENNIPVSAAFWVYDPNYVLVIVSPMVDELGGLPVYRRIHAAETGTDIVSTFRVYAVPTQDPVFQELKAFPADFESGEFVLLAEGYLSYAPYINEGQGVVRGYVYQLGQ